MPKTTAKYWNPLGLANSHRWKPVEGLEGVAEEVTLAIDEKTGDYTRLTRFKPGADTSSFGARKHDYPEEIMIIEGRLYDVAQARWLETGDYASRPPGEVHGPFRTDSGCVVLEISFPGQSVIQGNSA
jgi:quercetin dioxygenase-like cupin family protein